jgi:hypothetical protein
MNTLLYRVQQWFVPLLIATMMLGGLVAVVAPTAQATSHTTTTPTLITESELLPMEFSDNVGLGQTDLRTTIARIIRAILGFLGVIAVSIMLYGGFTWMTSNGAEAKVEKAQKIIVAGAIGLAIILSAFAITSFVVNQLVSATTSVE